MFVNPCDFRHKICNMVWCESLIFVRFTDILVKSNKEQIKQILTGCAFVVDKRQNVIFNEF